ncbi:uncharacterized protein [Antedon mediterranea]|uniref:uncharacterized protein n=1 Tax=Antedon mediterranea TaxID=105859 RepID=UPI003AF712F6
MYFLVILLNFITKEVHGQSIITFNQTAKEGDSEVLITCDYSQFTSTTPGGIQWDELNEDGSAINLVNDKKLQNGRFKLNIKPGKADLVMSQPTRNDSGQTFQCEIRTNGDIKRSNPSILTVYYLNQPNLNATNGIYKGQSMRFTCSKSGEPTPYITWYKDGQQVNNSRYEIANNSTESVLKIKSATEEDGGNYTCKAESDQFKGEDAKTSVGRHLTVYYIAVNFTSEDGIATCTADGRPKPSSVVILQDGELVKKGENTSTIEIDDKICQSNITCNAENGQLYKTATLENCEADISPGSRQLYIILIVLIILWLLLLCYFMHCKNIEWSNTDVDIVTVEGGKPVEMSWKYRPSIAWFKNFGIKKEDKMLGSNKKQFSSWKTVCQFVCYCCAYFCGFFCIEYCNKSYNKDDKKRESSSGNRSGEEYQMMVNERECPDVPTVSGISGPPAGVSGISGPPAGVSGTSGPPAGISGTSGPPAGVFGTSGPPAAVSGISGQPAAVSESEQKLEITPDDAEDDEGSKLLAEPQGPSHGNEIVTEGEANDSNRSQSSYTTNGRGSISLTLLNPARSDSGKYSCSIEGSRQQCPGVKNLFVNYTEMVDHKYSTEEDISNFKMKCRYGPADMPLTGYKWKKIKEDGTTEIEDCYKDSRFEVTSYQNSILSLKIKNVVLDDAGKYQCEVKPVDGEKKLEDTTQLIVKKDLVIMNIPAVTTNEGITMNDNLVTLGEKGILTCKYKIKDKVEVVNWCKKKENKLIFTSDESQQKKIEKVPKRCKATYKSNETSLEFEKVEFTDAGEYICELKPKKHNINFIPDRIRRKLSFSSPHTKSAHLRVQFNVFTAADYEHDNTYRRPAVVFINSHVLVFVEKNNSDVILRRGKMNIKSLIEWEESRVILHEEDKSFQNLVPIVTHNGKVILMCVKQNKNTKDWNTIKIETDDYGNNWKEPFDVKFPSKIEEITSLLCIDGVCLESGNLVLAGVCNIDNNGSKERSLLVIISTDDGDNCNIEHVIKLQVTSGIHTQVVEYGQDQVYIICTLEDDSTHLFIINSKDGCKTVDVVNEKEETNLECQSGIIPTKTDEFYQIAMASHGNETNKDLTLYLSEDGCKTWSKFNTLGAVNAEESDLAYYSVKEGEEEAEGIVCVYSYGSETEGYNIGMQLISKKEIKQTEI